jgi:hypothetical protein
MISNIGKSTYLSKRLCEDIAEVQADLAFDKRTKENAEEIIELLEHYRNMSWSN